MQNNFYIGTSEFEIKNSIHTIVKTCIRGILLVLCFVGANSLYAQDWPQYFGPNRDGVSFQKGIIRT
jgi:hypothetical protein